MLKVKGWILAILLVISMVLLAGCTDQSGSTVKPGDNASANTVVKAGDNVSVDYIGWYENGTIFDTSDAAVAQQAGLYNPLREYGPLSFIAGAGEMIKGFDNATMGMKIGESKNVTLQPDQAYGQYDPALILPVNMSVLTSNNITPIVNQTLYYNMQPVRVDSIPNNTTVFVDFNGPMAGKTLKFQITVKNIEAAKVV